MDKNKKFIVVICGPTASGKTGIGIEIASSFDGEIISADSMQIYKGMNIATAKPSPEDMRGIPHHLMDFYDPHKSFSVADYVRLANEKTEDILGRGKLPIIVGGTGLYISSFVDNIDFEDTDNDYAYRDELRELAKQKGNPVLLEMLAKVDPESAAALHPNNITRIIRALEVYKTTGHTMTELRKRSKSRPSPYNVCMIAFDYDRELLYERINRRVDIMLASGLIDEASEFYADDNYPTAAQAIGYKELKPFFDKTATLSECVERLKQETRRFAKRQMTWFRRDERIHWIRVEKNTSSAALIKEAKEYVQKCMRAAENKGEA